MKNKAFGGALRQRQHLALPRAVFVSRHTPSWFIFHKDKLGGALIDILYFLKLKFHKRLSGMRTSSIT